MSYETRAILAKKIRLLRHSRHWSQEKLAEVSGLHRTYIGAIERSERNISLDTLTKLATALGVSLAILFETPVNTKTIDYEVREEPAIYQLTKYQQAQHCAFTHCLSHP